MSKLEKVLVPVDFSDCSRAALDRAATIAGVLGAEIHVLHVWQAPEFTPGGAHADQDAAAAHALTTLIELRARQELEAAMSEAAQRGIRVASAEAEPGQPTATILRVARDNYDLIVMGTHGRTGFERAMLGSVAEKIVRRAPCPVMTVRAALADRSAPVRRLLVPVDYSAHSKAALRYACELSDGLGAALDVVHVWDRPAFVADDTVVQGPGGSRQSLADLIRSNAEQEMSSFLGSLGTSGDHGNVQHLPHRMLSGEPASTLIAELAKGRHDLVVVGTRGLTGLKHLLLGSIAEKLMRLSPVPVLTVPSLADS